MSLELGIDLGCKQFHPDCSDKSLLIFDSEQYRFQKFVSDLSGHDIHQHNNNPKVAVTRVRNWLRTESGKSGIPGGPAIYARYEAFRSISRKSAQSRTSKSAISHSPTSRTRSRAG